MVDETAFKDELKRRRKAIDLTQAELAHAAGCSIYTLQHIEEGTARPSRQLAELLAARLQVPPDERSAFVQRARAAVPRPAAGAAARKRQAAFAELGSPYKGLHAFQEADAPDFFGREALARRLGERLREEVELARFLAVVGPSGAGKSSVVRAGLIPALRNQQPAPLVADFTPGAQPFDELEAALLRVAPLASAGLGQLLRGDGSQDEAQPQRGLLRVATHLLTNNGAGELVLLIDQFEELFTLVSDERVRADFIGSLFSAVADAHSRLRILITLRADFYDHPLRYLRASELLGQRSEVVGPLAADELHQAIVGPAERHGLELEGGLAAAILHDVAEQPGALPLLQYALTELYERREGQRLTLGAYTASGGVRGALARRAEEVYAALGSAEQAETRQLFLRLVTPGEGAEDTRRRVPVAEVRSATRSEAALQAVLDRYGRYRMLTFDREPRTGEATVELAHEALLHAWGRLDSWLAESRERLLVQRRLFAATADWRQAGQEPSFLASGSRLAQFAGLLEPDDVATAVALTVEEHAYVAASLEQQQRAALAEREQQARELALQKRAANRLRGLVIGLALFLLVATGLAAWALNSRQVAQANLVHADALRLAAEASGLALTQGDNSLIALLSLRSLQSGYTPAGDAALVAAAELDYVQRVLTADESAYNGLAHSPDGRYLAAAGDTTNSTMLWEFASGTFVRSFVGHEHVVIKVLFSPDGDELLTASFDTTARLWDVQTGQALRSFVGHSGWVTGIAFSPDGRLIATVSLDGTARVWDRADGSELLRVAIAENAWDVAFSPDGRWLLTAEDKLVRLWDARTSQEIRSFSGPTNTVYALAFSPDGQFVAAGGEDGVVRIWESASGREIHVLAGHQQDVKGLAFSTDGGSLLSSSGDYTARLWDVATGQLRHTFAGHSDAVYGVAFLSDGRSIATSSFDGTVRIWPLQRSGGPVLFFGHALPVRQASFSPDGGAILTASDDQTVRVWDATSGRELRRFLGYRDEVHSAIFSPDGTLILATSRDGAVQLLDAGSGEELRRFTGHTIGVVRAAFSPDGARAITGSEDGTARVWDVASGAELARFTGHNAPVRSVAFSPDGTTVVSAGDDAMARIWDPLTGAEQVVLAGHSDRVNDAAFSPDGRLLATASRDLSVRLWDAATGQERRQFLGHTGAVYAVVFSADGTRLLSGANDQTARLWDVQTGAEVRRLSTRFTDILDVAFSPDGGQILVASGDRVAQLWPTDYRDTMRYLCGALTRDLSADERAQYGIADAAPTCREGAR